MKSIKIADIVKLQRILKKWRRVADSSKNTQTASSSSNKNGSKGIGSLADHGDNVAMIRSSGETVPKGYIPVCVGEEMKKFHVPIDYLGHQAFGLLLREAEEEFGFQQGVLRIPCDISMFESILKVIETKQHVLFTQDYLFSGDASIGY